MPYRFAGRLMVMTRFQNLKVLVVEDESMVAMLVEDMLEDLGCEILAISGSVAAALRLLPDINPDFALLDVNLAGEAVPGELRGGDAVADEADHLGPAAEQLADHRRTQKPGAAGDQRPTAAPRVRRVIHPVAPPRAAVLRSGQGPYPRPSSRVKRKRRRHAALRSSRFSHR